jgi:chromosome segregation ATPase
MLLNKKLSESREQAAGLKRALESKLEEYDQLEKEYHRTQDAHRSLMAQCHNIGKERETNVKTIQELQGQYSILVECQKQWEKERVDLHSAISDLTQKLERGSTASQEEIKLQKEKLHGYKTKIRQANARLKLYAAKLTEMDQPDEAF